MTKDQCVLRETCGKYSASSSVCNSPLEARQRDCVDCISYYQRLRELARATRRESWLVRLFGQWNNGDDD